MGFLDHSTNNIIVDAVLTKKIHLPLNLVGQNIEANIKQLLVQTYEGICNVDGYIKHKDSFTIVDFKTTKINENKIDAYATQLQSYALMMEKPKEGSLKLKPIKRLGIFCFEPSDITELGKDNCNMVMNTQWFDIPRDDKDLIGYITKIQDVLYSKTKPQSSPTCDICNFKKIMK